MLSQLNRSNYKVEDTSFSKNVSFDEVEPMYQQVCKNINLKYNCNPHFVTTLLYLVLPANVRETAINDIYKNIESKYLYKKTMNELLENIEINELLQSKYNIDSMDLLRFNDKQTKKLYSMFYESLYEISIDNKYKLRHYF
jgi:hypothetical protein